MEYDVSIIVPAYNEEKRLPPTLGKIADFLSKQSFSSELLVVSDGSKDGTIAIAETFKDRIPGLRTIDFPFNRGKGFSVKEGMLAATGRWRLFMDSDYAVPVDFLLPFLDEIKKGYDIVIASRALPDSEIKASQGFPRRQLADLFGYIQRVVLNVPYRDTQCGFKLFTDEAAKRYFSQVTYDCAYFDAELLYIAHRSGARIREMPVSWEHDNETRLPIGVKRTVEIVKKMVKIPILHQGIK